MRDDPLAEKLRVALTLAAIDAANAADPNRFGDEPLALAQGRAASAWLRRIDANASDELRLAVRAHHLRRWEVARSEYPEGRAGYLSWRRANKAHQADSLAELMRGRGWPESSIERTRVLLSRTTLRSDRETQTLEDAACLVFLQTQFDDMIARTDRDHLVSIVAKTLRKMSPTAVTLASSVALSPDAQAVLTDAVAAVGSEDANDQS